MKRRENGEFSSDGTENEFPSKIRFRSVEDVIVQ